MSIVSHEGKRQVCCDTCPASYPNIYAAGDFDVMVTDIKAAGWKIARHAGQWVHTCPSCSDKKGSLL